MDLIKIEWKKIRSCDICEKTGFVREIIDSEGKVPMEVCFYGCMDLRNTPTPDNSVCDYCCENKGTKEVYSRGKKFDGYYCERCKNELDSFEEDRRNEIKYKKGFEEERRKVYENEAIMTEEAKRFFDDYFAEPESRETIEVFVDLPEMYSSHAKYLKEKYKFESSKSTLKEGSYLIIND